jgi:uncharacterized protein YgbK (DUF1537 family)
VTQLLALADDLTGAMEVGALFAASGLASELTTSGSLGRMEAPALVVDLNSRHLHTDEAARIVSAFAEQAKGRGIDYLYKKTDSTLRGNIGAELNAILSAWPLRPLVYVPAYPRMGRTVRDGRLFVDEQSLEETAFSRDPLAPARTSRLKDVLEPHCAAPVVTVGSSEELRERLRKEHGAALYVCDGETDSDLSAIADVLQQEAALTLTAGPAGFVPQLAARLPLPRTPAPDLPVAAKGLVLNGSLHPTSRGQVQYASFSEIPLQALSRNPADDPWLAARLVELGKRHDWLVFQAEQAPNSGKDAKAAQRIVERLADAVRRVLNAGRIEAVVVFGGDTASAVLKALRVTTLQPLGELLPGVPVAGIRHRNRELAFVTKAGGFGAVDVVAKIRERLYPLG